MIDRNGYKKSFHLWLSERSVFVIILRSDIYDLSEGRNNSLYI